MSDQKICCNGRDSSSRRTMEKAGLAERRRSTEDRRVILVYRGPKALECKAQYEALSEKMTEIYFQGFTDGEINNFEDYLLRVLKNVRAADGKDSMKTEE